LYDGIILRDNITELYYGIILWGNNSPGLWPRAC
jgi:hypothetical protein